jgi:hypothetical protein
MLVSRKGLAMKTALIVGGIVVGVVLLVFVVAAVILFGSETKIPTTTTPKVAATVTEEQLWNAYISGNELAADKKYKDKYLVLNGHATTVGRDFEGNPYIEVDNSALVDGVSCTFPESQADALAKVKKGDKVSILGQFTGNSLKLTMEDCRLGH